MQAAPRDDARGRAALLPRGAGRDEFLATDDSMPWERHADCAARVRGAATDLELGHPGDLEVAGGLRAARGPS